MNLSICTDALLDLDWRRRKRWSVKGFSFSLKQRQQRT